MDKEQEKIEFSNKDLQDSYLVASMISEGHLEKLGAIGVDIRRTEAFLQKSGFGEFEKKYGYIHLNFDGKRLRLGEINLIETKVRQKLEAHPFLPDFLQSIASYHLHLGELHEGN